MLSGYRFEHPSNEERFAVIGGWSYLWAGLFGAAYLSAKGFGNHFAKALLINIAFLLLFLGMLGFSFALTPALVQWAVIVLSVPVVVVLQGVAMIRIIRDGYRRRGWWTTRL